MILRSLGISLIATGVIAVGAAVACSCVHYESAAAQLQEAEVMFIGRVEQTVTRRDDGMTVGVTRFAVERTLKGEARTVRRIEHSVVTGGMCGVVFQRDRTYTIIAHGYRGRLHTGSCSMPQFPLEEYDRALAAH